MTRSRAWVGASLVVLVAACGSNADSSGDAAGASGAGASGKASSGGSAGKSGSSGNAAAGSKAAGNAGAPNAGASGAAGNALAGAAGNSSGGNGQGGGGAVAGGGGVATGGSSGAGAAGKGGAGAGGAASGAGGAAGQGGATQGGTAGAAAGAGAAGGPASGAGGTGGTSAGSSGASGQQPAGAAGAAGTSGGAAGLAGAAGASGGAAAGGGGQAGGAAVCGVVGACTLPGTRDAAYWPFDPCSPWNHPIGDGAEYATPTSPDLLTDLSDPAAQLWLNWDQYSHPIYVASASDPVRTISAPELTVKTEVPNGVAPSAGSDGHLHVVDPTHHWVIETYQATVKPSGDIFASDDAKNDLFGLGVFDVEKYGGTRAYGGSSIGGIIRKDRGGAPGAWDEMKTGIRHALSAAVRRTAMNKTTPNGRAYVWPASYRDDGWQTTYGASGNVHMGSLLAIPKSVDLATLGLKNAGVKAVARALQDYGAYIVDATSDNLNFAAEPWVASAGGANDSGELRLLLPHVRVVVNNDPSHVGGGGTPLTCFAPPL